MAAIDTRTRCKKSAIYQGYQRSAVNSTRGLVVGEHNIAVKSQPSIFPEVLPMRDLSKLYYKQNEKTLSYDYGMQPGAKLPRLSTTPPSTTAPSSPIFFMVTPRTSKTQTISGNQTLHGHRSSVPSCYNSSSCNIEYFSFVHSPHQSPEMQRKSSGPSESSPPTKGSEMYPALTSEKTCSMDGHGNNHTINRYSTTCYSSADTRDQLMATESSSDGKSPSSEWQKQLGQSKSRRNLSREYSKDLTFKPAMNQNSMKIVKRSMRQFVPLEKRLLERKKKDEDATSNRNNTFSPKINANSNKLIQDRANRLYQVFCSN